MADFRDSLPPLPTDTDRQHGWIVIAAEPVLHLPLREGEDEATVLDIDGDWLDARVSDYAELTSSGNYEAAHITEHRRDGTRSGDIVQLATWTDPRDGRAKLLANVRWVLGLDASAAVETGALRYASPSWGTFTDELGKLYEFALCEISAVVAPHQKQLSPSHYLGEAAHASTPTTTELTMADNLAEEPGTEPEEDEKAEATLADVMSALSDLGARLTALEETPIEGEEPEGLAADEDEDSELSEVKAQLAEVLDRVAREDFAKGARAVLGACDNDVVEAAYQLSQSNPADFTTLVSHLGAAAPAVALQKHAAAYAWNLGSTEGRPKTNGKTVQLTEQQISDKFAAARKAGKPMSNSQYAAEMRANGHAGYEQ